MALADDYPRCAKCGSTSFVKVLGPIRGGWKNVYLEPPVKPDEFWSEREDYEDLSFEDVSFQCAECGIEDPECVDAHGAPIDDPSDYF